MINQTEYYFGYGSNLSKEQMAIRCPESNYFSSGKLLDYSWLINARGYASIKPSQGEFVPFDEKKEETPTQEQSQSRKLLAGAY